MNFIVSRVCLLLLLAMAAIADDARPNVLFVLSDDQRADSLGAYGNTLTRTPNLDQLAATGTVFTRAYCMGGMQTAICMPSRAMLMSGRTLFRVAESLKDTPTWPEAFRKAGYQTFATGKWHNSVDSLARSFADARSIFLGGMGNPHSLKIADLADAKLGPARTPESHSVKSFTDEAVAFIGRAPKDKPWLCYVALNLPHDPRIAPPEFHARYEGKQPPLPANFLPLHPFQNGELTVRDEALAKWPRTEAEVRKHLADYYACVDFVDSEFGRILAALDASGQRARTLIVFASDHGLAIGSHGLMGKQNLYEHSMRAPLVIAGPQIKTGRSDALCYLLDIFPTLGDLAAVAGPKESEGRSLAPVLRGESQSARPYIFTAYRDLQRAVRDERWKLIRYPKIDRTQLFDLSADPEEKTDLSASPEHEARKKAMLALLATAQAEAGDKTPLNVKHPAPADWTPPASPAR